MKLFACLLTLALPSALAIDFSSREIKEVGEGGEYTYLRFSDGSKAVTYMPPKHWSYQGGGNSFRLTPPNVVGSEIEISVKLMEEPPLASEENLKLFETLAIESLPKGATKVETTALTFNPCEIDGNKTVEVTLSYVLFGQALMRSRLYLARKTDMLYFTVVSKPGDFVQLNRAFQASLNTLAGL